MHRSPESLENRPCFLSDLRRREDLETYMVNKEETAYRPGKLTYKGDLKQRFTHSSKPKSI